MASGILGKAAPPAREYVAVYTGPQGATATVNISLCNAYPTDTEARLALSSGSAQGPGDFVEYDRPLPAHTSYERTGIVLASGTNVLVWAAMPDTHVIVYGFEEV